MVDSHRVDASREAAYTVEVRRDVLDPKALIIGDAIGNRKCLVVTTPTVATLYKDLIGRLAGLAGRAIGVLVVEGGESGKTLAAVELICRRASEIGVSRGDVLVGVGGGVCTDLVTVAASLLRRGVACIRVPTTLIGQIDAGIGIKGGVNHAGAKNHLGCFHPPERALIDPGFLRTLPQEHLRYGLAEVVKIALVASERLFRLVGEFGTALTESGFARPHELGTTVIGDSIELMLDQLRPNLFEDRDNRRAVDLGHTFSPLLESASAYTLHHGAAVAVDLALSACIGAEIGHSAPSDRETVLETLLSVGLPVHSQLLTAALCAEAMENATAHRAGKLNLVVPAGIGQVAFVERAEQVRPALVTEAIHFLKLRQERLTAGMAAS